MIHPALDAIARDLQNAGYRITSIVRPPSSSSNHAKGIAADVAFWEYSTSAYTAEKARALATALRSRGYGPAVVIAEQDHFHIQLHPDWRFGAANDSTQGQLQMRTLERGDHMFGTREQQIRRIAARLGVRPPRKLLEGGDAMAGMVPVAQGQGVTALARDVINPEDPASRLALEIAAEAAPDDLARAREVARVKAALQPSVRFIDYENASEISTSLGNFNALLRGTDVQAVANEIASGIPAQEIQSFPFQVVGAEWHLYPTYILSVTNGGQLNPGELFSWIGSILEITVPVLSAQAGLLVNMFVEYGPATMAKNNMTVFMRFGNGAAPVQISAIHGAQAGGMPRLQKRTLTVTAGAPVPGASWPRVRLTGIPVVAAGYQPTYRFMLPGDRATERFSQKIS